MGDLNFQNFNGRRQTCLSISASQGAYAKIITGKTLIQPIMKSHHGRGIHQRLCTNSMILPAISIDKIFYKDEGPVLPCHQGTRWRLCSHSAIAKAIETDSSRRA